MIIPNGQQHQQQSNTLFPNISYSIPFQQSSTTNNNSQTTPFVFVSNNFNACQQTLGSTSALSTSASVTNNRSVQPLSNNSNNNERPLSSTGLVSSFGNNTDFLNEDILFRSLFTESGSTNALNSVTLVDQSLFDSFQSTIGLHANNSNNSLLKLDIDSLFLDPCNWIETKNEKVDHVSNTTTTNKNNHVIPQEKVPPHHPTHPNNNNIQTSKPLQTTHSTSTVSPQLLITPQSSSNSNNDYDSSNSSSWITNNSQQGNRTRLRISNHLQPKQTASSSSKSSQSEPSLQKITTHINVHVESMEEISIIDEDEECMKSILHDEEFGEWFFRHAPANMILTCNPKFTFNVYHKPLGATHSVFVNDDILVHIPRFDSDRIEDLFCNRMQLQMRSYLVSSVVENPNERINNISQIDHLTALEFYENLSDSRFVSSSHDSSFLIKVPIKRDNTSKRGKRKEKLNSIANSHSPSKLHVHSDESDNSSSIIDQFASSPKKKKKGESAPKKIIFLILIDRESGDILYRSELLWQRSKTKREMEQKKPLITSPSSAATNNSDETSETPSSSTNNQKKRRNNSSEVKKSKKKK